MSRYALTYYVDRHTENAHRRDSGTEWPTNDVRGTMELGSTDLVAVEGGHLYVNGERWVAVEKLVWEKKR